MKTGVAVLFALLASASAFTGPPMATRAVVGKKPAAKKSVGTKPVAKKAPAKKVVKKVAPKKVVVAKKTVGTKVVPKKAPVKKVVKKVVAKKVVPKKVIAKKVVPKKVVAKKVVPKKVVPKKIVIKKKSASGAYPSFSEGAQKFKIKGVSGGGNNAPVWKWDVPDFSDPKLQIKRDPAFYAAAAKTRLTKTKADYVFDDGLTEIERRQKASLPMFLSGSAKSQVDKSAIVGDIEGVDYFGLSGDRFQLLMISIFALFTLVGCLSGNLQL